MANLIRSAAGALLFAAALALSLPGASVRADSSPAPDSASAGAAPMCRADAPIADPAAVRGAADTLRGKAAAGPSDDSVRVLNGAGYNYVTNRKVDFRAIEREIRMQRARSH